MSLDPGGDRPDEPRAIGGQLRIGVDPQLARHGVKGDLTWQRAGDGVAEAIDDRRQDRRLNGPAKRQDVRALDQEVEVAIGKAIDHRRAVEPGAVFVEGDVGEDADMRAGRGLVVVFDKGRQRPRSTLQHLDRTLRRRSRPPPWGSSIFHHLK
jgi:hypothetical protein